MEAGNNFKQWKKQCLSKVDFSKKGSVDGEIENIVSFINECHSYFTTSSCSGRIILIDGVSDNTEVQKQNCSWLFVTHQKCQKEDVLSGLQKACGDAVFKFEPFVLHVQCKQLEDAQLLHSVAINSGFRNSGITVGKKGKIIMAVRSTHCLEVPLSHKGQVLVQEEYIDYVVQVANRKIEENRKRIERFHSCLLAAVGAAEGFSKDKVEETKAESGYTQRRKRGQEKTDSETASPVQGDVILQNGDEDSLESELHLFCMETC
ncbi:tRNA wybutosine-synthesizing protein 3 homolog [Polyodon spathula]|uniref:tRNA wybutosine-synthesizing protein 3 homolog n=1 Tax=Polyodon spathula TaxID=7913 RepID=UPI001B7E8F29|nr:tRNA wybutosine-synthesizing protein 3 homolog [Polyodon spathula]